MVQGMESRAPCVLSMCSSTDSVFLGSSSDGKEPVPLELSLAVKAGLAARVPRILGLFCIVVPCYFIVFMSIKNTKYTSLLIKVT